MSLKPLALSLLVLLMACSKKPAPVKPTYPVQIGEAIEKRVPLFIEALGHVESINSVNILSRIEGELMEVYFTEGQEVRENDLLVTIDPRPYEAALKKAQGELEENLANLALSEEKVKRYAQLTLDEYYSQIDYETIQADFASNTALVKQSQADVDTAALNLDYCWIYAPVSGLTGILQIDKGNLIADDGTQPIVLLNQMAPIYVTFSIPEVRLRDVRKAMMNSEEPLPVEVAFEDFKESFITGKMHMVDNMVDLQTGMIKLRAIFPNNDRALWPGQFVRSRVILSMQDAVIAPYAAIQQTLTGPIIYVVKEDSTVEIRKVKLGQREDDNIIILDGLKAKERIVIEGQINLFKGAKVFVPGPAT